MENKIKELIQLWNEEYCKKGNAGLRKDQVIILKFLEDLQSLLEFKQKNCGCGNFIIEEVTHKQIELAAYNRGHHDGYMQSKNEGYK